MQTTNRATQRAAGRKMNCLQAEYEACNRSFTYWLDRYGTLYDATARGWTRFHLWPSQAEVADSLARERLVIILKARQLGMTWLVVGRALWLMLFRPAATVLLFSQRDDEAVHLLGFRLAGMYERLPAWQHVRSVVVRNAHEFRLSNGSAALAFPTTGGRSYTATLAIVDEADHVGGSAGATAWMRCSMRSGRRSTAAARSCCSRPWIRTGRSRVQAHLPGRARAERLARHIPAVRTAARRCVVCRAAGGHPGPHGHAGLAVPGISGQ